MKHSDNQPLKEVTVITLTERITAEEDSRYIIVAKKDEKSINAVASAIADFIIDLKPANKEEEQEFYRNALTQSKGWHVDDEHVYSKAKCFVIDEGLNEHVHSQSPHPVHRGDTVYVFEDREIFGVYSVPLDDLIPDVCYPIIIH